MSGGGRTALAEGVSAVPRVSAATVLKWSCFRNKTAFLASVTAATLRRRYPAPRRAAVLAGLHSARPSACSYHSSPVSIVCRVELRFSHGASRHLFSKRFTFPSPPLCAPHPLPLFVSRLPLVPGPH
ncbi:hypothetical protein E2C01_011858 [Portunus trituberculatus]|uniref:Uncharacterized protein n=1 Tax=Portunus trituberculatus TaxID=210409 RepID=A0A5B7DC77_PORTR|nr:hypothetical protein [Portunus trituberculatus]